MPRGNQSVLSANLVKDFFPVWPIGISIAAWVLIFIAIPPGHQDFPLGDDWAFSHGAIWFSVGKGIHYSKWASMPQLGQWVWSWPFLKIISLPQVALRISVLVLSWLGLGAFCGLMRLEKIPQKIAVFATVVLALNPIFFLLQGSYMTDVPALSFALLSMYFYARARAEENCGWLWPATAFAILAVTTRQTMLAVPLAAGAPLVWDARLRAKLGWGISIVAPIIICLYANWWFSHRPDVLKMRTFIHTQCFVFRPFVALHLCGLSVIPFCLLKGCRMNWKIFGAGFVLMMLAAIYYYISDRRLAYGGMFPYTGGLLSLYGTYSDDLILGQRDILLTPGIRVVLTILGCAGGAAILEALWQIICARKFLTILTIFSILVFLMTLVLPYFMDRYLMALFPGAMFLVAARTSEDTRVSFPAIAVAGLIGLVAIALLHDLFSWNSARWQLGREAVATKNLRPTDIEGGFEWDGWYEHAEPSDGPFPMGSKKAVKGEVSFLLQFTRDYFLGITGNYALAFTPPTNSVVLMSQSYSRWLPPAKLEFYLVGEKP